jgi:hypothetical protein
VTQPIPPKVRLAANAIRESAGACHQSGREIGCDYCFSKRYRGCVFLGQAVVDALFPPPGSNGNGDGGIRATKAA